MKILERLLELNAPRDPHLPPFRLGKKNAMRCFFPQSACFEEMKAKIHRRNVYFPNVAMSTIAPMDCIAPVQKPTN